MSLTVRAITAAAHREWIATRPHVSFLQTPAWGEVKSGWQAESLGWFAGSRLVGAGLALYRQVPRLPRSLAYLPGGPDLDWTGERLPGTDLDQWLQPLLRHARDRGAFTVKLGPEVVTRRWSASTVKSAIATGMASGLTQLPADEEDAAGRAVLDRLVALGWTRGAGSGAGFGDVQPRHVFCVPLAGRTLDDVFAGFNQQWRRNIRLATKAGVTVTTGSYDDLPAFHEVYVETAERDGFTARGLAYFQHMWRQLRAEDPNRLTLYLAHRGDELLAATTMTRVGDRAWYSYGASTTAGRDARPSNAIQWAMLRDAHAAGCSVYDLRGISDTLDPTDHLFGLVQFKLGTGGYVQEYAGEWDYPVRPLWHKAFRSYLARRQA
ncbi:MAG: peptidoglycan bridge formation glycyltransferase FemA/FemB family protein [Actinomycetota bacterium]|nr:MAG: peptidoglycan bridge formation glycyltransferase FemA/FemB family protein [Actinomycetota bacterium]